mgnify:CR=1 FL=1
MPDEQRRDPQAESPEKRSGDRPSNAPSNLEAAPGISKAASSDPTDPKDIYDLAPAELPARPPIASSLGTSSKKPEIDKEGLLTGFDEDADFETDPDVQRAKQAGGGSMAKPGMRSASPTENSAAKAGVRAGWGPGAASKIQREDAAEDSGEFFVEPGLGSTKVWLIIGGLLLVSAVVAAAVNQREHPVLASLLVLYNGFLHTGTGVAAVGVGAMVAGKRLGPLDLTAGRMFAAVAGMLLLANCNINLVGSTPIEELTLGAIVYIAVVAGTFRFWGQVLATVVSAHFLFWLVIHAGMAITEKIGRTPLPAAPQ